MRRIAKAIGLLIVLVLLAYGIEDWRGHYAWQKYVAEAKAHGESLDPASVIPPPVPDSENLGAATLFAPLFDYTDSTLTDGKLRWRDPAAKEALENIRVRGANSGSAPRIGTWAEGRVEDLSAWQEYYRKQIEAPKSPPAGSPPEGVLLSLSRFDEPYGKVRAACALPRARFPLHYEGTLIQTPHTTLVMGLAGIAALRACAELSLQRNAEAFDDVQIGLRLCESVKDEPLLISLLVRCSLSNSILQPIWEGIVRRQWSEDQLAKIGTELASINFPANYQLALRGERILFLLPSLNNLQKRPADFAIELYGEVGASPKSLKAKILTAILRSAPSGWCDWNKVAACRCFDEMIAAAEPVSRRFLLDRAGQAEIAAQQRFSRPFSPYSVLARISSQILYPLPTVTATAQTKVNLACVAIALERHRLRHGAYPESLANLDPECQLNGIPADVITGAPPVYSVSGKDAFTLEYQGWKEANDGAGAAWKNQERKRLASKKGAWAWPQLRSDTAAK